MAYSKTTWNDGDVITKEKMNNLEAGVETANNGIPAAATTSKAGIVKQAANVAAAAGETERHIDIDSGVQQRKSGC